ncbi:MAG: MFS transporter [Pseudomonadota bacterium]
MIAAIAAITAYCLTSSLTYTLLSLILERRGFSAAIIGLNASMTPLGIILSAPFIPALAGRVGGIRTMVSALIVCALILAALGSIPNIGLWFLLRFLFGVTVNAIFVVSETWINQLAPTRLRGRIIAAYAVAASIGFAGGPSLISVIGSESWLPFGFAILGTGAALVIVLLARHQLPPSTGGSMHSFWRFLPLAPTLLMGVAMIGLFEQTILALLPIYGLSAGLSEARAAFAVAVLIAGNILLQFPIGWIADRLPRRQVRSALALTTGLLALTLPFVFGQGWLLWPVLVIWGSVAFGIYTVSLAELGDRFEGEVLLAGNAAFAMMWGVGGLLGPAISGPLMTLAGPNGLPASLAFWFLLLAFLIVWRRPRASR